MHEGLYRIEVHRESGVETFEIPNHVTRFTKWRQYLYLDRIGIKTNHPFEDDGIRIQELRTSGSPAGLIIQSMTSLGNEVVSDGIEYRRRSASFFSGPCTVYGLCVQNGTSATATSNHLVSFVDLPSSLELAASDFLYVWYSLKHRWPYAS